MKVELVIDQKSVSHIIGNLQRKAELVRGAAKQAVDNTTEKVFQQAQELVPVRTGALKDSGKTSSVGTPDNPTGVISYGDDTIGHEGRPTSSYAISRHEMRSKLHPEAYKWLERTLLASDEDFREEALRLLSQAIQG